MKEVLGFIGILIVGVLLGTLIYGTIKENGYKDGYKQGQIDAMNGVFKYKLDTTKIIKYIEIK
jgi:hypothetical protein